ncbi:MAG TPA: hypothetical protein VMM18_06100 [Gemmatimonadaceae bacterium]|nr:hypothetical protein [Gemmatimonadaceae bacterium]
MRALRPGSVLTGALTALIFVAARSEAQGLDPYPVTLYYGTGLVTIPVAWVAPVNADVRLSSTGKRIPFAPDPEAHNFATLWNTNLALETHWLGRVTAGVSLYSQNPEWGLFGSLLLLRDGQVPLLPSVAVGVRNVGRYKHEDRFKVGHDLELRDTTGGLSWEGEINSLYTGFNTANTLFAVATKELAFAPLTDFLRGGGMSVTVGWGNGLFSDDGGLGRDYNNRGTIASGLFLGTRLTAHPTLNTTLHLLAENDGWDWNAGLVGDHRGLALGVYVTEIEEGSRTEPAPNALARVYNYKKWNVGLSYSGNIIDISRGVILRTRITELTREAQRLRLEIAERERRILALEVTLRRAQAGELAEIERRRREMEAQVDAEREEIRRLMERLQQIERGQRPPPPTPPEGLPATPVDPSPATPPDASPATPPDRFTPSR